MPNGHFKLGMGIHIMTVMILVFVFGFLLIPEVLCMGDFRQFLRIDASCSAERIISKTRSLSRTQCLLQCKTETSCRGVSHNPDTMLCIKCSGKATPSSTSSPPYYELPAGDDGGELIFGNFTYKFVIEKKTWDMAKQNCENIGGYLITIKSSEEQAFIESVFKQYLFGPWIGGKGTPGDKASFQWVDGTNISITYENWAIHQPRRVDGRECMKSGEKSFYEWKTKNCSDTYPSVCKFG